MDAECRGVTGRRAADQKTADAKRSASRNKRPDARQRKLRIGGGAQRAWVKGWFADEANAELIAAIKAEHHTVGDKDTWKKTMSELFKAANQAFREGRAAETPAAVKAQEIGKAATFAHRRGAPSFVKAPSKQIGKGRCNSQHAVCQNGISQKTKDRIPKTQIRSLLHRKLVGQALDRPIGRPAGPFSPLTAFGGRAARSTDCW